MMRRMSAIAVLGLLLGLAAPSAQAAPGDVSLQSLIDSHGTITLGNLTFGNFGYTANTGDAPSATNISVNQIPPNGTDVFGNFGLRFGLGGFNNPAGAPTDFLITYSVTAPSASLTDIHLASNLALTGAPAPGDHPLGQITETVMAPQIGTVGQINNHVDAAGSTLNDQTTFNPAGPYTTLFVTKDVFLRSTPGSLVTVSFIDQSFSVPEPGSFALLGMGCAGLLGIAWRRRRARIS
jgi:hypothetical protein